LGVSKDRLRSEVSDCTLLMLREDSSAETGSDTVVVTGVDNDRMLGEGCDVTPDPRGGLTPDVENRLGEGEGIVEAEDDDDDNEGGCIERGGCC